MEIKNKLLFFVLIMTIIIQLSYGSDDNDKNFNKNFNDEKIQVITNKNSDIDSINETTTNTDVKTALLDIFFENRYNDHKACLIGFDILYNENYSYIKSIDDFKIASKQSLFDAEWNIDLDKKSVKLIDYNNKVYLNRKKKFKKYVLALYLSSYNTKEDFNLLEKNCSELNNMIQSKESELLKFCETISKTRNCFVNQIIRANNKRILAKFSVFIATLFFVYVINPIVLFVGAVPWIIGYFTLSSFLKKTNFSTKCDKLYHKSLDCDKIVESTKKYYDQLFREKQEEYHQKLNEKQNEYCQLLNEKKQYDQKLNEKQNEYCQLLNEKQEEYDQLSNEKQEEYDQLFREKQEKYRELLNEKKQYDELFRKKQNEYNKSRIKCLVCPDIDDRIIGFDRELYIRNVKQASWRYKGFNNLILLTQLASLGLSMYGVNKILLYFKVRWYANARRYCSVHIVNPIRIITANSLLSNLADI